MSRGWFPFFLLLFIAFPIAEIALLISVGQKIGLYETLAIVIGTAILGTTLLRSQGFGVLARVSEAMGSGKMPIVEVMEGMFLLIAGAFLLTPGLITDSIGLVLLVPSFRIGIARFVLKRMLSGGFVDVQVHSSGANTDPRSPRGRARPGSLDGDVIEGEFERVDDETNDRGGTN